jgi:hypothetical protein
MDFHANPSGDSIPLEADAITIPALSEPVKYEADKKQTSSVQAAYKQYGMLQVAQCSMRLRQVDALE